MSSFFCTAVRLSAGLVFAALVPGQPAAWPATLSSERVLVGTRVGGEHERGPHHQVIDSLATWRTRDGALITTTNRVTVLATGLFYRDGDRWLPSREEIVFTPRAAVAETGPHRIECPLGLGLDRVHALETCDGQEFRWQVLGLQYRDPESGRRVWIARTRSAHAELAGPNTLVYRDAFDGVKADLLFEYAKASFAQDVVLRTQLPDPALWGLSSDRLRIEIVTEFLTAPEPRIDRVQVWRESDPIRAAGMREPALTHDRIEFGAYRMAAGQVFWVRGTDPESDLGPELPVLHRWARMDGCTMLFESVEFDAIRMLLDALPPHEPPPGFGQPDRAVASNAAHLSLARGLVLDWTMANGSQKDVTFRGGSTYLVAGVVNLSGTTTLEGGAVVKYTNNGLARLNVEGDLVCDTAPYRPAVFTANADDSVGDITPRGAATDYYAAVALQMPADGAAISNVRILRARTALYFPPTINSLPSDRIEHVQVVNCQNGVVASGIRYYDMVLRRTLHLGNGLFAREAGLGGTSKAIVGAYLRGTAEHLTLDGWTYMAQATGESSSSLVIRNSVLANVVHTSPTPRLRLRGSGWNGFYAAPAFGDQCIEIHVDPFTRAGAGRYYLGAGSPFLDRGTDEIDPDLMKELEQRTVWPPLARAAAKPVALDTTLGPTALRDNDGRPDLGWHYAPLDWCWTGLRVAGTNGPATLLLTNGVAVGIQDSVGTILLDGARFLSEGSPSRLNRLVRCETVQEQPAPRDETGRTGALFSAAGTRSISKEVQLRFTEVAVLPGKRALFDDTAFLPLGFLSLRDCRLHGVSMDLSLYPPGAAGPATFGLTNNLFHRSSLSLDQDTELQRPLLVVHLRNNLFEGGRLRLADYSGSDLWGAYDNTFDTLESVASEGVPNGHNGYSGEVALSGSGGGDVTHLAVTTRTARSTRGASLAGLVNSAALVDAGSRSAADAGLYHHATVNGASKEADSQVDIGYHEVAAIYGRPFDSDSDGLPDYIEDANGNGVADDRTDWTEAATEPDAAGYTDLQELELASNILVNDPAQDYANEQNTQYQPGVVVLGNTVVVGYWDSNRGIYGLASLDDPPDLCRMVSYSVSHDGGRTFVDRDVLPLPEGAASGDAGDPVLAVDRASGVIYYAATSERKPGTFKGIPLWKSADRGARFVRCPALAEEIERSDYPWIAVDDWPGTGQHDVYAIVQGSVAGSRRGQWLTVSRDGDVGAWSRPVAFGTVLSMMPQMEVGPGHVAYVAWNERGTPQSLEICAVAERGATIGPTHTICKLRAPVSPIPLRRSNAVSDPGDWFKAFCLATLAVNPDPARSNHLYVTYADQGADQGAGQGDRADIFFVQSTDGGVHWTANPIRVNLDAGLNDQWMPALAVRPGGEMLFVGWHDRRNDPDNSLIEVYGRWAAIAGDGVVSFFTNDFRITSEPFPPAFSGSLPGQTQPGHYDPVWAPGGVNLHWWYPWYAEFDDWGQEVLTSDIYSHESGEHNQADADAHYAYMVWPDNRSRSQATRHPPRNQADIRLARLPWPQP